MPRRIEIELTSARDDGTWTWRAAGAKAPKGNVAGDLLPASSKVGDVLRVEAEFYLEGIEITSVVPPKAARQEPERLTLLPSSRADEPLVTSTLASRPRSDDRRPRRDGPRREGPRRDGPPREGARRGEGGGPGEARGRGPRTGDDRPGQKREGGDRPPRRNRPAPPPMPAIERPKAKRLRPGRTHRNAFLEQLPEDQRRIAEQVVLGGLPAVRQAIEKQNAERAAQGESAIAAGPLLELAEKLVPRVRAAEWRDRAEAAERDLEHLDLRDLRSVVSAADARSKDPEVRALADKLTAGLSTRVDAEHAAWLEELTATLDVGRIVRALRVSSRPPKAGAPLPAELSNRLTTMAGEALTADAAPERWVAVLDALAFSPVRDKVIPTSLPVDLHEDVRSTIARLATRIPKVAHIFEIAPDPTAPRPKPERRRPKKPQGQDRPKQDKPKQERPKGDKADKAKQEQASSEQAPAEQPGADQPVAEQPVAEPSVDEQAGTDVGQGGEATGGEPVVTEAPAPEQPATTAAAAPEVGEEAAPVAAEPEPAAAAVAEEAAPVAAEPEPAPAAEPPAPPHEDDVWVAESSLEERPGEGPATSSS